MAGFRRGKPLPAFPLPLQGQARLSDEKIFIL